MEHVYAHTEWREVMIVDSKDAELHVSCLSLSLSLRLSHKCYARSCMDVASEETHTQTHTRTQTSADTHTHTCAQPDGCIYPGESHIEIYYKGTQVVVPTQILKKKKRHLSYKLD